MATKASSAALAAALKIDSSGNIDADTLDTVDSLSFTRSDQADIITQNLTLDAIFYKRADYNVTYYKKADDTTLGYLLFRDDGPSYLEWNGNNHGQDFAIVSNNSRVLTLKADGNVGIGTDSPDQNGGAGTFGWANQLLTVAGTRPTLFLNGSSNISTIRMWPRGTDGTSTTLDDWHINTLSSTSGGFMSFAPQGGALGAIGLNLFNTGNVGIGTSTPNAYSKLHVKGSTGAIGSPGLIYAENTDDAYALYIQNAGNSAQNDRAIFEAVVGSTSVLRVNNSGNVGIGTTTPEGSGLDVTSSRTTGYSSTTDQRSLAHIIARNGSDAAGRFASISLVSGGGTQAEGSLNLVQTGNYVGDLTFKLRAGGGSSDWRERVRVTSGGTTIIRPGTTYTNNASTAVNNNIPLYVETEAGNNAGAPPTSGSTPNTAMAMRLQSGGNFNAALDFGAGGGAGAYIQYHDRADYTTHYNLHVQPNGGKLAVGTANVPVQGSGATWDMVVNSGVAIGDGTYTYGAIHQNGDNGSVYITANAYPGNLGVYKKVVLEAGNSGGGGPTTFLWGDSRQVNADQPFGLPQFSSDPTGLRSGQLYFNTSTKLARIYDAALGTWSDINAEKDPYWANVSAYIRGNGVDQKGNWTVTPVNVSTSTSPGKPFPSADTTTWYNINTGTNNYLSLSGYGMDMIDPGEHTNFTLEFWMYRSVTNSSYGHFYNIGGQGGQGVIKFHGGSNYGVYWFSSNGELISWGGSGSTSTGQWDWYVYQKEGSTNRTWKNGTLINTNSNSLPGGIASYFQLGGPFGSEYCAHYFDELRVTAGVARYGSQSTIPVQSAPWPTE